MRGDLIHLSVSEGRMSEDGARCCSVVLSRRTRRQWGENDAQEFPPEHEEELLYCANDSAVEQIDRKAVESPLLGIFMNCLNAILCSGIIPLELAG